MKTYLFALAVVASGFATTAAAQGIPGVCSTTFPASNGIPVPDQTVSACETPPLTASSYALFTFQNTGSPDHGALDGYGTVAIGSVRGGVHVSLTQAGLGPNSLTETTNARLLDRLTVSSATHANTPGTLTVPLHATGRFRASTSNIPVDAPVDSPRILLSFGYTCAGQTFGGGCGHDSMSQTLEGSGDVPLDEAFALTIPFVFGEPVAYDAALALGVGISGFLCAICGPGYWISGNAAADERVTFGPATIVDQAGDAVPDAVVVSDSGYDYLVSEPAADLLGLAAAGCCFTLRRRRWSAR